MAVPAFEFTDRAVPIVQMGRSANREQGDARWGTAQWGTSLWGARDWEPVWTDLTCEIHEITTDTGRAGAVDRFRPGTATVVASNVHGVSKMIWPPLPPPPNPFEFVPQPPIDHEEDLQAPNAATLISNGWSFTDDFETAPPRWIFPPAWDIYPCGPFKQMMGDLWEPERYYDDTLTSYAFRGAAAAQWTRAYDWHTSRELVITVDPITWPAAPSEGTPTVVFELYARMNTVDKACDCMRVTYTPGFGATNNTIVIDLFRMGPTGTRVTGVTTPFTYNLGAVNGVFPASTFGLFTGEFTGQYMQASVDGASVLLWTDPTPPAGDRFGIFTSFAEGFHTGASVVPRITDVSTYEHEDDLTRPTGSGWYLPQAYDRQWPNTTEMVQTAGAMRPPEVFVPGFGGTYTADGLAYFDADFDGDQFIEVELSGMSMPDPIFGLCETNIQMFLQGNRVDQSSIRCVVNYFPDWDGSDNWIYWEFSQVGPNGDTVLFPDDSAGEINVGEVDGVFPEPAVWRVEADLIVEGETTTAEARLYLDGDLLGTVLFPDPPKGGRIGVWMDWEAGSPEPGSPRPSVARFDRISGGLQEPLGTEELGSWIRIGVDHAELGERWFFRGFVDGIVPTYIPNHQDAVRIECIDSLGEAGRAGIIDTWIPHKFAAAPTRIRQLLNAAHWPANLRQIHDDSTLMSRPANGKAVDGLTRVAESCGGAVYGDPVSGDIVFKGTDWQGVAASLPPLAVITNVDTEGDELLPRVCPVGWELSKRRGDLLTRVRLSSETSDTADGHPIVKEWRSPEMEHIYGVELYEATVLAITAERINELAIRQLRVRGARDTPRVEAVLLDAATADEALDLMATATFTIPSKYRCSHHADDDLWAFNTNYLVTGVRHRIRPTQWTCRLALDLSAPFHETGGRWGRARWSVDVWGKTR